MAGLTGTMKGKVYVDYSCCCCGKSFKSRIVCVCVCRPCSRMSDVGIVFFFFFFWVGADSCPKKFSNQSKKTLTLRTNMNNEKKNQTQHNVYIYSSIQIRKLKNNRAHIRGLTNMVCVMILQNWLLWMCGKTKTASSFFSFFV